MQFSIIVPIYKVEPFLKKCVDSILAQTYTDFEVILVDDGSPDRCPEICDAYAAQDPRVRVIHKPNGGLVSARNAGIFASKGDYITYVDGDDWVQPNMLQFVHDRMEEATEPLDMVIFGAEMVFSDHSELLPNNCKEGWYNRERLEKEIFPYLLINRTKGFEGHVIEAYTWNKPCRRELQMENYVRDERISMFTDIPITYECLLNCKNVYICNEPLYLYNQTNINSILTLGKQNYLSRSFDYLAHYFRERLKHYDYSLQRQWNDYLAHLVVR
ncbi:MAG: glycosyltransferase family 2 protein, partial [bacterium]